MDSKYMEMILFLQGNLDFMPQDIPKLTEVVARTKIPGRLVNPLEGLDQLDGAFAPVDLTDEEEASGEVSPLTAWGSCNMGKGGHMVPLMLRH